MPFMSSDVIMSHQAQSLHSLAACRLLNLVNAEETGQELAADSLPLS